MKEARQLRLAVGNVRLVVDEGSDDTPKCQQTLIDLPRLLLAVADGARAPDTLGAGEVNEIEGACEGADADVSKSAKQAWWTVDRWSEHNTSACEDALLDMVGDISRQSWVHVACL